MDANTLYWFFSTVAQTLVALIALAGIVAVYRMEQLSRASTRILEVNESFISGRLGEIARRPEREVISQLEDWCNKYKAGNRTDFEHAKMIVDTCKAYDDRFKKIKKSLLRLIGTASATIFLSLCFLMIVNMIKDRLCSSFLMALIIGGAAVSIFQTVLLFTQFMGKTLLSDPGES